MKPSPKKLKETKNIYHKVVDHLISEGYAIDSDSADNIIKGMSDEWFETIIETPRVDYLRSKFDKENIKKSGSAHTEIPGKQNTGQALYKAGQSAASMAGPV
jgi:hypothetical protein